jgi:hypothetical protein
LLGKKANLSKSKEKNKELFQNRLQFVSAFKEEENFKCKDQFFLLLTLDGVNLF